MRLGYLPIAGVLTILVALAGPQPAAGAQDWVVAARFPLPLVGDGLDLTEFQDPHEPLRFAITGELWSRLDGSHFDARNRAFVQIPDSAAVVTEDAHSHRYVFAVPANQRTNVRFSAAPLAARHLVTHQEALASLSGVLEVEVLTPPPAIVLPRLGDVAELSEGFTLGRIVRIAGACLSLLALCGLLGFRVFRRRGREEAALLVRSRRAALACEREAARLGPAFDEVASAARRMHEAIRAQHQHLLATDEALDRTRSARSDAATARRGQLHEQRGHARMRLQILAERLEETSVELAAAEVDHSQVESTESTQALLSHFRSELDLAVEADREAHGISERQPSFDAAPAASPHEAKP